MSEKKLKLSILLITILVGGLFLGFDKNLSNPKAAEPGDSQVSGLTNNGADYANYSTDTQGSTEQNPIIPKYEKFELTFDIDWYKNHEFDNPEAKYDPINAGLLDPDGNPDSTNKMNPYWPYDEDPVANTPENIAARGDEQMPISAGKGISVDGLFLKPGGNWSNSDDVVTQPGFIYQGFQKDIKNGNDWLYPEGQKVWKIRFAPTELNIWQYKIRITDNSGVTYSSINSLKAVNSVNKGFVKVSPADSRYFETSNGEYLNLTGLNYDENKNILTKADLNFPKLKAGGINLIRNWWQGSQAPAVWGIGGQSGITGGDGGWDGIQQSSGSDAYLSSLASRNDELLSGKFALGASETTVSKHASTNADVIEGKTYKFSIYVKTKDVVGLDGNAEIYLAANGDHMNQKIAHLQFEPGSDLDWTELSATYTIPTGYNIHGVDLAIGVTNMQKRTGADPLNHGVWFTDASLKEKIDDENYGPEMIAVPNFGAQTYVNQKAAWKADYIAELAKQNDIYLDVVTEEAVDPVFQRIGADGLATDPSPTNIYATDTSANRVYQQYYWRYFMARYNYSTAIHSLELFNEGATSDLHANALEAFAYYMKNDLKSNHLITSSLTQDLKAKTFWSKAPDVSYATFHKYISEPIAGHGLGWAETDLRNNLTSDYYYSAPNSFKISTSNNSAMITKDSIPIPVTPGDQYKLTWKVSSKNMSAGPECKAYAGMTFKSGSESNDDTVNVTNWLRKNDSTLDINSNLSWTEEEMTRDADSDPAVSTDDAKYLSISLVSDKCAGDIYFDDVDLLDLTTSKKVNFPNGNFDEPATIEDSALIPYWIGSQVGRIFESSAPSPRVPVVLGETGLANGSNTDEANPELVNDTAGIWYKKFIWGEINSYSVTGLYYNSSLTYNRDPSFLGYSKAYQNFMSGIELSNGKYSDAEATISGSNVRAWGQKEISDGKADKAHLWIDNAPYTWKNVADGNLPPSVSGTVTIPDMKNGKYKVEWWDTTTGVVESAENQTVSNNQITLIVNNMPSDKAVKLKRYPDVSIVSPSSSITTMDNSVAVQYKVDNGDTRSQTFNNLTAGVNQLNITKADPDDPTISTTATVAVTYTPPLNLSSNSFSSSWNMVSFPDLTSLTNEALGINSSNGFKLRKYDGGSNSYVKGESSAITLTPGAGYWLHIDDPGKLNGLRYALNQASSTEIPVTKGWNLLGNPYQTNLPLSNLQVKYKDGTTRSYADAITRKEVSGYAWSWNAVTKNYDFIAINPDNYKTSSPKTTAISPFRGFWIIVKSDQVSSIVMNK